MIDFVKVALDRDTAKQLLSNPRLDFRSKVSEQTGEHLPYPKVATYKNLLFKIRSANYCELSGSLHQYAHGGVNYTDFSFADLVATVLQLQREFGIDPHRGMLKNVEIGVNLTELLVDPPTFIRSVLTHKGEPFGKIPSNHGKSVGVECRHQQYRVKVYDKSVQYQLPYPMLRYEVHYNRMKDLAKLNIVTLSDLINRDVWPGLIDHLLRKFSEILVAEPNLRKEDLTAAERRKLARYENPKYWENLKIENARKHDYHRRQYRQLIRRYVVHPTQSIIAEKCREKMEQLLVSNPENSTKLTGPLNQKFDQINYLGKGLIPYTQEQGQNLLKLEIREEDSAKISGPNSTPERRCKTTGIDISDQRAGSKFVSAKKVGYREAHRARNQDSNGRNNLRRRIERIANNPTGSLFPLGAVLKLSEEQKQELSYWQGTKYELTVC